MAMFNRRTNSFDGRPAAGLRPRRRRGAAVVEFAVVAPLLFLLVVLPIVEFGRAMMVSNLLVGASEAGCRNAVLPYGTTASATTAVNSSLSAQGISGAIVTVKVNGAATDASTAIQGDTVSVTVSVPYGNISWLPTNLARFLGDKTLSSTQVMRRE
jgi:Flp pilus assembly protein TadG